MKRILSTILVAIVFSATFRTAATTMQDVYDAIAHDTSTGDFPTTTIIQPPYDESGKTCQFAASLHFTITALHDLTFRDLFDATKKILARDVVSEWNTNVIDEYTKKHPTKQVPMIYLLQVVANLKAELENEDYATLAFGDMISDRLDGKLKTAMPQLDKRLDDLINYNFQFPLLDMRKDTPPPADRRNLLGEFVINFRSKPMPNEKIGLGNFTWQMLYYTPANPANDSSGAHDPNGFSDAFIGAMVTKMQGIITPKPLLDCPPPLVGTFELFVSNNLCCCNNFAHTSPPPANGHLYRTCTGSTGYNCISVGAYCSLMGSQFCAPDHGNP